MASSSRVWVWIGGSSPARTRHSTTAQSPPDCSPASLSSELVPLPWVTVRPAPGPERTGSFRAMVLLLDWERTSIEGPVARVSTAPLDRVIVPVNGPEAGPATDHVGGTRPPGPAQRSRLLWGATAIRRRCEPALPG